MFGQLRWGRLRLDLISLLTLYSWYRVIQIWFKTMTRETQPRSGKLSLDLISFPLCIGGIGLFKLGFKTMKGETQFGSGKSGSGLIFHSLHEASTEWKEIPMEQAVRGSS